MSTTVPPEQVILTPEDAEALKARIQTHSVLSTEDIKIVTGLITFSLWLQQQLSLAKLSIRRLKKIFGFSTEKKLKKAEETAELINSSVGTTNTPGEGAPDKENKSPPKRDPNENHGRHSVNDYIGCPITTISHQILQAGDRCPACAEEGAGGKVYPIEPGVLVRLEGHALITGNRYHIEKLRCHLCSKQYTAEVPAKIAQQEKYAPSCYSSLAIGHYTMGLPFKRIEYWQGIQDIPLADATQWDKVKKLSQTVKPVHQVLETHAAQGDLVYYDDTPHKILTQPSSSEGKSRKGTYTTAIISQDKEHEVYLFYTSHRYAAENITSLLSQRETEQGLITMSDASPNNLPKDVDETLLARWILCFCLVHGRRKFYEIVDCFNVESLFVLEQISQVYEHESACKAQGLDAKARLAYHQKHSAPLMSALWAWLNNQLLYEEVESNSGLGKAIRYMLKYWDALTRFLHHAGAPIDNNLCEQMIKVMIRYRKNSFFFKTINGAKVGDCLMSVIHTAARNGINPFDYLNALQEHTADVAKQPEVWLPWNYQHRLSELSSEMAA